MLLRVELGLVCISSFPALSLYGGEEQTPRDISMSEALELLPIKRRDIFPRLAALRAFHS